MADFEQSITVMVGADAAFEVLSDPTRLPDYVATMRLEDSIALEGELDLDADLEERDGAPEARFFPDRPARRLDWGLPGGDYEGSIVVTEGTRRTSGVTIRLHTPDDADLQAVQRLFDQTVLNIRRVLSGR
jgi:hypothetical protein